MRKTKKAIASIAIAGMALTMIPFNVFAAGTVPTRIAGVTAEQTAVQIADQTGYTGTAILASSTSYGMVDALTAGPLATYLKAPILLTGAGNTLDAATKAELIKLAVKTVYVTSGTAVIKQGVLDELAGMNIDVVKLGGFDRAATSVNIASKMVGVTKVAIANGLQDALSSAAVASAANQPILMTDKNTLPVSVKEFLAANASITSSDVIGGTGIISDAVANSVPGATRHFGMTAYDTNSQVIQDFAAALKFDNIYVASGVTGIDALAGAPLAAQTKSAIVLTDGKTVPAVAAFTYSKSNANTVVTALGGAAVVPEAIRLGVAAGQVSPVTNELKIVSVSALDDTNRFLEISFSKAVTKLEVSDISIAAAATGARYGVKAVTLSSNGLTATIELFSREDSVAVLQFNTAYNVTVSANGQVLKSVFNRPFSTEVRVMDIDVANKKITVRSSTTDAAAMTLKVLDPKFNYKAALGELVQVWYNVDKEIVKSQIVSSTSKFDSIEITKVDEIKLISENKKYDTSTETYRNATTGADTTTLKFAFYLNGSTTASAPVVGAKYNYAKVGYDKSGDIAFVSAYNLSQFLIVDSVDGDEVVGIEGEGTGGAFDAEDATIVKNGVVVTLADLKKGDVLYFNNSADGDDGFAEVFSKSVTGEIDNVFSDSIEVDGKTYKFAYSSTAAEYGVEYGNAVYVNEDGDTEYVDSDAAEDLQASGEVTLNLDRAGNLVYIAGKAAVTASNTQAAILTDSILGYSSARPKVEIETLSQDGTEKLYDIQIQDLDAITVNGTKYEIDTTPSIVTEWNPTLVRLDNVAGISEITGAFNAIKLTNSASASQYIAFAPLSNMTATNVFFANEGSLVKLKSNDSGKLLELQLFAQNSWSTTVKKGDKYLNGFRLLSSTVVYDATDASYDADDLTITTWGEYTGSDIATANYIVKDNDVVALTINTTTTSDAVYDEAVLTSVLRNTDSEIVRISAFVNGVEKTITVDKVTRSINKGDVVVIKSEKGNDALIKDIVIAGDAQYNNRVQTGKVVETVDVGTKEVKFIGDSNLYKLVSNGAVLDATDTSDITVETLTDLRGKTNVTVMTDTQNSIYAKYFVIGAATAAQNVTNVASALPATLTAVQDATTLTKPVVPAGYTIAITAATGVIASPSGVITPAATSSTSSVTFVVTNTATLATASKQVTVTVPADTALAAVLATNTSHVAAVKTLVQDAAYTMTQASVTDEAAVKTAIEAKIATLALNGVTPVVTKVLYTPAVAGNAGTPAGVNGTYTFTVALSKGAATTLATATTTQETMTITATAL